ncbi:MAG: argininosuccinate synthase [Candidatus Bathyarchaeia archaeon]|nr:argininosuccinate synthase [Candidatus Bathyarchaeota archaeon]
MPEKAVLAYSGGLDTSVAVKWIQEKYGVDVITVTVDVGQGIDPKSLEEKAKASGASSHYHLDAREEFIRDYAFRALKANALYEGKYPLSTALSRPLIASKLVEVAEREGASMVAHGCSGKGNDQVRFDISLKALAPNLRIVAPIREWGLTRPEEIKYAECHGISIPVDLEKPYSVDQNLWGRSIECGKLDDPYMEPPEEAFEWTVAPEKAPDKPAKMEISYENGVPIAVNGEEMSPVELVGWLNKEAGRHGVGRIDHIEDRIVGIKSREVYECPAATILIEAHRDLEKAVLTRHEVRFKAIVEDEWSFLVYSGLWVDPLREALDAFIDSSQHRVEGRVKLKVYKGGVMVVGRSSRRSLYDANLASYGLESAFNQRWSEGFIELWGMPSATARRLMSRFGLNEARGC